MLPRSALLCESGRAGLAERRELQHDRGQARGRFEETELLDRRDMARLEDCLQNRLIVGSMGHGEVDRLGSLLRDEGSLTDLNSTHGQKPAQFLLEPDAQRGCARPAIDFAQHTSQQIGEELGHEGLGRRLQPEQIQVAREGGGYPIPDAKAIDRGNLVPIIRAGTLTLVS